MPQLKALVHGPYGDIPLLLMHGRRGGKFRGTVLLYHGLGASKDSNRAELASLADKGFLAVGIDAIAHGERRATDFDHQTGQGFSTMLRCTMIFRLSYVYVPQLPFSLPTVAAPAIEFAYPVNRVLQYDYPRAYEYLVRLINLYSIKGRATAILEWSDVPESTVARVLGHRRDGFNSFDAYNPMGPHASQLRTAVEVLHLDKIEPPKDTV